MVPTIVSDYGFMGQDDGKCMPMLCIKDKKTKRVAATFVTAKGVDAYAVKFFVNFMIRHGTSRFVRETSRFVKKGTCCRFAVGTKIMSTALFMDGPVVGLPSL